MYSLSQPAYGAGGFSAQGGQFGGYGGGDGNNNLPWSELSESEVAIDRNSKNVYFLGSFAPNQARAKGDNYAPSVQEMDALADAFAERVATGQAAPIHREHETSKSPVGNVLMLYRNGQDDLCCLGHLSGETPLGQQAINDLYDKRLLGLSAGLASRVTLDDSTSFLPYQYTTGRRLGEVSVTENPCYDEHTWIKYWSDDPACMLEKVAGLVNDNSVDPTRQIKRLPSQLQNLPQILKQQASHGRKFTIPTTAAKGGQGTQNWGNKNGGAKTLAHFFSHVAYQKQAPSQAASGLASFFAQDPSTHSTTHRRPKKPERIVDTRKNSELPTYIGLPPLCKTITPTIEPSEALSIISNMSAAASTSASTQQQQQQNPIAATGQQQQQQQPAQAIAGGAAAAPAAGTQQAQPANTGFVNGVFTQTSGISDVYGGGLDFLSNITADLMKVTGGNNQAAPPPAQQQQQQSQQQQASGVSPVKQQQQQQGAAPQTPAANPSPAQQPSTGGAQPPPAVAPDLKTDRQGVLVPAIGTGVPVQTQSPDLSNVSKEATIEKLSQLGAEKVAALSGTADFLGKTAGIKSTDDAAKYVAEYDVMKQKLAQFEAKEKQLAEQQKALEARQDLHKKNAARLKQLDAMFKPYAKSIAASATPDQKQFLQKMSDLKQNPDYAITDDDMMMGVEVSTTASKYQMDQAGREDYTNQQNTLSLGAQYYGRTADENYALARKHYESQYGLSGGGATTTPDANSQASSPLQYQSSQPEPSSLSTPAYTPGTTSTSYAAPSGGGGGGGAGVVPHEIVPIARHPTDGAGERYSPLAHFNVNSQEIFTQASKVKRTNDPVADFVNRITQPAWQNLALGNYAEILGMDLKFEVVQPVMSSYDSSSF